MASSSSDHAAKPEETGGGESSEAPPLPPLGSDQLLLYRGLKKAKKERGCTAKERISKMPPCTAGKRSSFIEVLPGIDGLVVMKHIFGIKVPGTKTKIRRESKDMTHSVAIAILLFFLNQRGYAGRVVVSLGVSPNIAPFPGAGDEMTTASEYAGGYSADRKIDLSNYIKWWGPNKSSQTDFRSKTLDETNIGGPDDVASELKSLEWSIKPTEPYEMPRLGVSPERMKHKKISAMSILLKSAAYKSLQEKISKKKEKDENDENENKNNTDKVELGKAADKSCHDVGSERHSAAYGISGGLPIHRNMYPLAPLCLLHFSPVTIVLTH
ncbi:UNVERIFIED_CONTAM: AP2-like ethylene-responsive transcription factor [Sesamum radiatum]|uniref:AP2-like ethylene-responsive transcription factor n=1 Tax=Sesamum radiatum TaxID=300843 RepID=A0AAW2T0W4_SESRA